MTTPRTEELRLRVLRKKRAYVVREQDGSYGVAASSLRVLLLRLRAEFCAAKAPKVIYIYRLDPSGPPVQTPWAQLDALAEQIGLYER